MAGRPRGGPPVGGRRPGAQALRSRISGLDPSFLISGYQPHRFQISGTRVPTSLNLGFLFYRISNIWGSGPCVHQYLGFIPPRVQISDSVYTPFKYLGFRLQNQESGIQQLSPSRRRTGPRGQIRLSPPPLQGRLPGPTPQEGQKLRKRWQGERSPCPSSCLAEPLEDPERNRKRWGTIVTPTR